MSQPGLKVTNLHLQEWWRWIGVGAMFGYCVLLNIGILLAQTYLNREPLILRAPHSSAFWLHASCPPEAVLVRKNTARKVVGSKLLFCVHALHMRMHGAPKPVQPVWETTSQAQGALCGWVTLCWLTWRALLFSRAAVGSAPAAMAEEALQEREINRTGSGFASISRKGSRNGRAAANGHAANGHANGEHARNGGGAPPVSRRKSLTSNGSELIDIELGDARRVRAGCYAAWCFAALPNGVASSCPADPRRWCRSTGAL